MWRGIPKQIQHANRIPSQLYKSTGSTVRNWQFTRLTKCITATGVISVGALWWSTTTRDDVPLLEVRPLDLTPPELESYDDYVTRMLRAAAYSIAVKGVGGISRYDGAQLPSNSPCEDRFLHGQFASPWHHNRTWMAWAVFDGHTGWQTADLLEKQLLSSVQRNLSRLRISSTAQPIDETSIHRSIANGFVELDDSIVKLARETSESGRPLPAKIQKLSPAFSGSCALLSLYDPSTNRLHVACTGDSRAILAEQGSDGKWEAKALSVDQTGSNEDEVARLNREHPGEEDVVRDGRVLGLMVSRAFGDGRWKWPQELQNAFARQYYAPRLASSFKIQSPPYLTAEPVVTTTTVDPTKASFLIMATDGLWDTLSTAQAVQLVGTWLASRTAAKGVSAPEQEYASFDFSHFWKGVNWKFEEDRTTIRDENAAVHLMRNSLGGNHTELVAGRLAVSSPLSRDLRDDITVQVVFFNIPSLQT